MNKPSPNEIARAVAVQMDPAFLEADEGKLVFDALWREASEDQMHAKAQPDAVTAFVDDHWETPEILAIITATPAGTTERPEALQTFARFVLLTQNFPEICKLLGSKQVKSKTPPAA